VRASALVRGFYERIWNAGDFQAIPGLLAPDFKFRGSLGVEVRSHEGFERYVRSIRGALSEYRCEILDCVAETDRAFARMRFSGIHTGIFRGYPPTGKPVYWLGAALFHFKGGLITDLWVLGDLAGLDEVLRHNQMGSVPPTRRTTEV
jgi:predicted ester cyclase